MNIIQINAFLRKDFVKKDKTSPIYLRVQMGDRKKVYSLNVSCKENFWDKSRQEIKPGPDNFVNDNIIINSAKDKARELLTRANLDGETLCFADFDRILSPDQVKKDSFLDFWDDDLTRFKSKYSGETHRTNKSQMTKLKQFRSKVSFKDVTPFFWKQYESWLIDRGNNTITIHKAFRTLKAYLNKAIVAGCIKTNPLKDVKVKHGDGSREFLSLEEVQLLQEMYDKKQFTKTQMTILQYFLFACYTGLRFTDVKSLLHVNVHNDNTIKLKIHKTQINLVIPLHDKANALITPGLPFENIFRVYSNQPTNRYLKEIMTKAKIEKNISFHCARHTFATICLSDLEVPLTTVQKLLGHTEIRHTQIYARVLDKEKTKAMDKWNAISF